MRAYSIPVYLLMISFIASVCTQDPTVKINSGKLLGSWKKTYGGRTYAAFEGVPYAKAPLGKYRFMEPQKLEPWLGVWDATKQGSKCAQINRFVNTTNNLAGAEDCLFVNVYTANHNENADLPVVVHIHGGAFMFGTGNEFLPTFLLEKDLVYVSINYRLNIFGFLSTGDDVVPGNMGLKDQSAALHWIQKNIKKFGGDPNSVTITGLSAGGASVHFHMLSPLSRGTFHRALSFSGTSLCPWTTTVNPLEKIQALAKHIGCYFTQTDQMIECLRQRPAFALLEATKIFDLWKVNLFSAFTPVVEPASTKQAFLKKLPYKAVQDGDFSQVPWIATVTSEEGLYPAAAFASDELLSDLNENWESLVSYLFVFNDTLPKSEHPVVARKIKEHYTSGSPISTDTFSGVVQALGDRHFVVDCQKTAQMHVKNSVHPIYFYYFKFRGPESLSDTISSTTNNYGVSHADDVFYVFHSPHLNPAYNEETLEMSRFLTNLIYSFAVTGIPDVGQVKWETVDQSPGLKYLEISSPNKLEMKSSLDLGRNAFWKTIGFEENENIRPVKNEL